jgi:hypothetical protein
MSITGVKVKLIGENGNAFAIMGRVTQAMRRAHISKEVIDEYLREAKSGGYNHLLATTLEYVDEEGDEEDDL